MSFALKPTREWTLSCRGKGCGQRISKMLSGKIVNDENGVGGLRNEDHVCPGRLETGSHSSGEWAWMQKDHICGRCSTKFSGVFVDCPFCFKLCCQRCGHLQDWRVDKPENRCKKCDYPYLAWMIVSVYIEDGICRKMTSQELETNKLILMDSKMVRQVKQLSDCNNRGHILRKGDKNCRVCGIGVIRNV